MNDNEIIKALECCTSKGGCLACPLYNPEYTGTCVKSVFVNALDLINHQKTEIEGLQKRIVFWRDDMDYHPEKERAEAIKEFAEKLKQTRVDIGGIEMVAVWNIDSLVNEMTEAQNAPHNNGDD